MKRIHEFIRDQRELAQNDLQCILDGLDDDIVDNCCQVIVDRFNLVLNELGHPQE